MPGHETIGPSVTGVVCRTIEVGSQILLFVADSPLPLGVFLGLVLVGAGAATRATRWSLVGSTPVRRRRAAGQILRAARRRYRARAPTMLEIDTVFVPLAVVASIIQAGILEIPL